MQKRASTALLLLLLLADVVPIRGGTSSIPQNLVANGDFSQGSLGWRTGAITTSAGGYPRISFDPTATQGAPVVFDVPFPSDGYIEQSVNLPSSTAVYLSLTVEGSEAPTIVNITLTSSAGRVSVIGWFDVEGKKAIGGVPTTRTYDITRAANDTVKLRIRAYGEDTAAAMLFLFEVRIVAASNSNSVITLNVPSTYQTGFITSGTKIVLGGQLFPPSEVRVYINFTSYAGASFQISVESAANGSYSLALIFPSPGIWRVQSYWKGYGATQAAESSVRDIVVAGIPGLRLVQGVVNSIPILNLSSPSFEALTNETIDAKFVVNYSETFRFTNVFVLVLDSWEPFHWFVLSWQQGSDTEPISAKGYYVLGADSLAFTEPNANNGLFVTTSSFAIPLSSQSFQDFVQSASGTYAIPSNATSTPTFKMPTVAGTYYLMIIQSGVQHATNVGVNGSLQAIWTMSPQEWAKFVNNSGSSRIQTIKVLVTDRTTLIDSLARSKLAVLRLENQSLPLDQAQAYYNEALGANKSREFGLATGLSDQAFQVASASLNRLEATVKQNSTILVSKISAYSAILDVSGINVDKIDSEIASGNYRRAEKLIEDAASYIQQQYKEYNQTIPIASNLRPILGENCPFTLKSCLFDTVVSASRQNRLRQDYIEFEASIDARNYSRALRLSLSIQPDQAIAGDVPTFLKDIFFAAAIGGIASTIDIIPSWRRTVRRKTEEATAEFGSMIAAFLSRVLGRKRRRLGRLGRFAGILALLIITLAGSAFDFAIPYLSGDLSTYGLAALVAVLILGVAVPPSLRSLWIRLSPNSDKHNSGATAT